MLVYGDPERVESPRAKAGDLRHRLTSLPGQSRPVERHAAIAEILVEAGELEQGLLDAERERRGADGLTRLSRAACGLTRAAARALLASFRSLGRSRGAAPDDALDGIEPALDELLALELPDEIAVHVPEGFAFYGLYPETYLVAAEALPAGGPVHVVGIRSIGTALASLVAAVVEERAEGRARERACAVTVRPVDHPFARRLALDPGLALHLMSGFGPGSPPPRFAVVDEGPGLSGSSFGCVADWLEDAGVEPAAVHFFPSHRGDLGPQASERHRQRWSGARRHVVDFEEVFTAPGGRWPLEQWVEDVTGPAEAPLEDLGAGRWRERLLPDRSRWPAVDTHGERRKFLLRAGGRPWLLKFAGLGRYGRSRLELAEVLGGAGLIPPVSVLRYGFLVGPWLEGARPLSSPGKGGTDRAALLDAVSHYLAFRADRFPVPESAAGASPDRLLKMAAFNAGRLLGDDARQAVEAWYAVLPEVEAFRRPVLTDNRLHAWEWLVLPGGRILKADALDHHQGNDLVGPQDLAWDVAGAIVELELDDAEAEQLAEAVQRRTRARLTPSSLAFHRLAYLAFQAGRCALAAEALSGTDPEETARLRRERHRYAACLRQALVEGFAHRSTQSGLLASC